MIINQWIIEEVAFREEDKTVEDRERLGGCGGMD